MPNVYVERPRTCEARQVTTDTAADVADWCGGMATPDGRVMFPVGDVWLTAAVGHYVVRENERLCALPPEVFEAAWAQVEE